MKKLFAIILLAISFNCLAQDEYKASNGITYHPGDTVRLGRGTGNKGSFVYVQMGGWYAANNPTADLGIGQIYGGTGVVIKKIKSNAMKGLSKVYFVVGGGNLTNYNLFIEDAIATCEIADCNHPKNTGPDKYDQLAKIKDLFDKGALTKEEYEKEKAKILSEK